MGRSKDNTAASSNAKNRVATLLGATVNHTPPTSAPQLAPVPVAAQPVAVEAASPPVADGGIPQAAIPQAVAPQPAPLDMGAMIAKAVAEALAAAQASNPQSGNPRTAPNGGKPLAASMAPLHAVDVDKRKGLSPEDKALACELLAGDTLLLRDENGQIVCTAGFRAVMGEKGNIGYHGQLKMYIATDEGPCFEASASLSIILGKRIK